MESVVPADLWVDDSEEDEAVLRLSATPIARQATEQNGSGCLGDFPGLMNNGIAAA
jgi:hypothetical protein